MENFEARADYRLLEGVNRYDSFAEFYDMMAEASADLRDFIATEYESIACQRHGYLAEAADNELIRQL